MSTSPEENGLVFSREKIPIPRDREGILEILSKVLTKPYIQSIQMGTSGYMNVDWYRAPMDTLLDTIEEEPVDSVLSRIEIEEVHSNSSVKEQLVDTYLKLMLKGYVPTFILCGSGSLFKSHVDLSDLVFLPRHTLTDRERYLGMQLVDGETLPEDVVVVCGSHVEGSTTNSIIFGYKILLG